MIPLHDDNPTSIAPIVTVSLIGTSILIFLWQVALGPDGFQRIVLSLGLIPSVLFDKAKLPGELTLVPPEVTVISSMFLHGGWMHLLGNMLYLWIFGNNVEDAMGHSRFLAFYFLCGIVAALGQAMGNPTSTIPMIGASGAISGVLGAYLLLYPHARILVLVPIGILLTTVSMRAFWVLVFWFVLQLLYSAMSDSDAGGVAWFAHISGFIAGMAFIPLFKYRKVHLFNPPHRNPQSYQ